MKKSIEKISEPNQIEVMNVLPRYFTRNGSILAENKANWGLSMHDELDRELELQKKDLDRVRI